MATSSTLFPINSDTKLQPINSDVMRKELHRIQKKLEHDFKVEEERKERNRVNNEIARMRRLLRDGSIKPVDESVDLWKCTSRVSIMEETWSQMPSRVNTARKSNRSANCKSVRYLPSGRQSSLEKWAFQYGRMSQMKMNQPVHILYNRRYHSAHHSLNTSRRFYDDSLDAMDAPPPQRVVKSAFELQPPIPVRNKDETLRMIYKYKRPFSAKMHDLQLEEAIPRLYEKASHLVTIPLPEELIQEEEEENKPVVEVINPVKLMKAKERNESRAANKAAPLGYLGRTPF